MASHSSILAWRIPWTEEPNRLYIVHGVAKSRTGLSDFTFTFIHKVTHCAIFVIAKDENKIWKQPEYA